MDATRSLIKDETPIIRYATLDISKCRVDVEKVQKEGRGRPSIVKTITDTKNGIILRPTPRFWKSLFAEYKLGQPSESFFDYFPYEDVFNRIKQVTDSPLSALCVRYVPGTTNVFDAYGLSRKNTQTRFDGIMDVLEKKRDDLKDVVFDEGIIRAIYHAKDPVAKFDVAGDKYEGQVEIEIPIDGLGNSIAYIGAERLVCRNGATAISPVFRSTFKTGEDGVRTVESIIEGFRNEDGFIQLKKRFENADLSYISMREVFKINKLFQHILDREGNPKISKAVYTFSEMLGDFATELGISSFDQVSDKAAAGIPMRPTVLSMIQLLSECSSHYVSHKSGVKINTFIGSLISNNYDLELSKNHMGEYDDFLAKH